MLLNRHMVRRAVMGALVALVFAGAIGFGASRYAEAQLTSMVDRLSRETREDWTAGKASEMLKQNLQHMKEALDSSGSATFKQRFDALQELGKARQLAADNGARG